MSAAPNVTRRRFLQLSAATGAAAVGSGAITSEVEAFETMPVGGSTGATYLVRKMTNIGGGQTVEPGSSTPGAIAESWFRTGGYAKEHDSTMVQTVYNRLEDARTIAYVRAKSAALEAIQNGEKQSFVMNVAKEKVTEHYTTVQTNILNHWKVQFNKMRTYTQEIQDHSEMSNPKDYVRLYIKDVEKSGYSGHYSSFKGHILDDSVEREATLADGTTKSYWAMQASGDTKWHSPDGSEWDTYNYSWEYDPTTGFDCGSDTLTGVVAFNYRIPSRVDPDGTSHTIQVQDLFPDSKTSVSEFDSPDAVSLNGAVLADIPLIWDRIGNQYDDAIANIETWVNNAYGAVQAGERTVEELVAADPYVLAQEWSTSYQDTGHLAYAAADLATLGLSFDSENKMVFRLNDGTELEGTLYTSDDDFSADVGTEIDPATRSDDFYIAADTSTMQRELPEGEYRESIDGGEVKLNVGAVEDTQYLIKTSKGEQVSVQWDAWQIEDTVANEEVELRRNADSLVIDLSDRLEEPIASVESITHLYAGDEEATVMEVTDPFVITEAYDVETGEEVDTVQGNGGYDAGRSEVDLSWTEQYLEMRDDTDDYAENDGGGGGGGVGLNIGGFSFGSGAVGAITAGLQVLLLAGLGYLGYDVFISDS